WITPSAPNKTYYLPFQFAVVYPAMACKDDMKVHYTFDLNKQFQKHATDLFGLMKKDENFSCRDRMGELSLAASADAPGLQAADVLAYQTYQYAKIRIQDAEPVKGRVSATLSALLKNKRDERDFPFFDESSLDVALEHLPAHWRK